MRQQAIDALHGNPDRAVHILRAWLKQLARSNQLGQYCLEPLEYADSVRRTQYLLSFDQATCSQGARVCASTNVRAIPICEAMVPCVIAVLRR